MQRSEVRGSRTAGTANSRTDGHGQARTASVERRGVAGAERVKRSLKHTGARPVDGAGGDGCAVAVGRRLCFTGRVFGKVQVLWLCNYF